MAIQVGAAIVSISVAVAWVIARWVDRLVARIAPVFGLDALYIAVTLVGTYFLFLRTWSIWDDTAIYQYMAWGVRHGQVLYRDTINMNWPGTVMVHLVAQSITGMDPAGVRIVECAFLGVLGLSTSALLREYGVPTPIRLAAITFFLVAYFLGGFEATAQRESFMTPCLAAGLFPLLTANGKTNQCQYLRWVLGGAFGAFGLLIKPTIAVPLAGAVLTTVIFWGGRHYGALWKKLGIYLASGLVVLLVAAAFLARYGDLPGFWRWGVQLAFGPYAELRYAREPLLGSIIRVLNDDSLSPTRAFCGVGVRVLVGVNVASLVALPFVKWSIWTEWCHTSAKRIFNHLLLVALVAWTIYVQGKTHCIYHFIPLKWALVVLGAVLCGQPFSGALSTWLRRYGRYESARRAIGYAAFVVAAGYWATYAGDLARNPPPDPLKERWKVELAKSLRPGETVAVFGYVAPTVLCVVQRPSPLPFVDSWIMYAASPDGSQFRQEYVDKWQRGMTSPNLRFFIVQHGARLKEDLRYPDGKDALSEAAVAQYFPPAKLAELGFARSLSLNVPGFDIYERATASVRPE